MAKAMEVERQVLAEFKAELEMTAKNLKDREDTLHLRETEIQRKETLLLSKAFYASIFNDRVTQRVV